MTISKSGTERAAGRAAHRDITLELSQEETTGLAYVFWGRLGTLGLLAAWVAVTIPFDRSRIYLLAIVAFALLGAPPYLLARRGIRSAWLTPILLLLDAGILTYILIVPPPFAAPEWTAQINLRLPNFIYLGIFLVGMALSYSPTHVVWAGVASVMAWSAGFAWVARLPGSLLTSSHDTLNGSMTGQAIVDAYFDPRSVSLTNWYNQLVFLALVTGILALSVWRSRRLVRQRVATEAEYAALSRYFSPNLVGALSKQGGALDRPSVQPVAVLFADMVGFTGLSERLAPDSLVALLREFHSRLVQVAFAHGGTIDKYIGDAIMVNFGTPKPQPDDPVRALACAAAMIAEIRRWSAEREARGESAIEVGVGVHYGDVIVGNIGDAQRLEYTVLGDTVNVASRLERLTRELGCILVVSGDLVRAVGRCGVDPSALVDGLALSEARTVRGRRAPIEVWCASDER